MNISRYIEITSSYRDRSRFPNPSQFNIELALSGQKNAADAKDPVYQSVVKYPPPNLDAPITYPTFGYMYGRPINGTLDTNPYVVGILPIIKNTNFDLEVINPLGNASRNLFENGFENGYIGDTLELVEYVSGGTTITSHEYRKIVDYRVLPSDTIASYMTGSVASAPSTTSIIANISCNLPNFLIGWELEFTTTSDPNLSSQIRKIIGFDSNTKTIYFDMPIENATIASSDQFIVKIPIYEIRIDAPFSIGALASIQTSNTSSDYATYRIRSNSSIPMSSGNFVSGTTNQFTFPTSVGTFDYTNQSIWVTSDPVIYSGNITITSPNQFSITTSSTLPSLLNMTLIIATDSFIITEWNETTKTGKLNLASLTSGVITGTIVQPNPSAYYKIQSYNPTTRTGTITSQFSYQTVSGKENVYAISSQDTFEILQFKTDNYHPLDYAESMVHQQQVHCYEISLISLTIPNVPLKSGTGGHIAFYPFVYVEFRSITQGTNAYNFTSNNPVIQKNIMFKAPMVYNYHPSEAAFITLDGHGMVQQLKFKPNDSFNFAVYLPNGELFLTEDDYMSPSEPNPLLQISACFKVTRLT